MLKWILGLLKARNIGLQSFFFSDYLPTQWLFCPTFTSSVVVADSGLEANSFAGSRYNSQLSASGTVLADDVSQTVPAWPRYNTRCQLSITNTDGGSRRRAAGGVCARLQRRHTRAGVGMKGGRCWWEKKQNSKNGTANAVARQFDGD